MKRTVGVVCAAILIIQAGCSGKLGNTRLDVDVEVDERAIEMTLDEAVTKVQTALAKRGLEVAVNPDGDVVRVVCKTKAGDTFTVVLTRGKAASGKEQTRVRIEWGTRPDRELWVELLVLLGVTAVQAAH